MAIVLPASKGEGGGNSVPETRRNLTLERYLDRLVILAESVVDLEDLPLYQNMAAMQNLRAIANTAKHRTGRLS